MEQDRQTPSQNKSETQERSTGTAPTTSVSYSQHVSTPHGPRFKKGNKVMLGKPSPGSGRKSRSFLRKLSDIDQAFRRNVDQAVELCSSWINSNDYQKQLEAVKLMLKYGRAVPMANGSKNGQVTVNVMNVGGEDQRGLEAARSVLRKRIESRIVAAPQPVERSSVAQ